MATKINFYTTPVITDIDGKVETQLVATTVEELIVLINEERIDTENNYLIMDKTA